MCNIKLTKLINKPFESVRQERLSTFLEFPLSRIKNSAFILGYIYQTQFCRSDFVKLLFPLSVKRKKNGKKKETREMKRNLDGRWEEPRRCDT